MLWPGFVRLSSIPPGTLLKPGPGRVSSLQAQDGTDLPQRSSSTSSGEPDDHPIRARPGDEVISFPSAGKLLSQGEAIWEGWEGGAGSVEGLTLSTPPPH